MMSTADSTPKVPVIPARASFQSCRLENVKLRFSRSAENEIVWSEREIFCSINSKRHIKATCSRVARRPTCCSPPSSPYHSVAPRSALSRAPVVFAPMLASRRHFDSCSGRSFWDTIHTFVNRSMAAAGSCLGQRKRSDDLRVRGLACVGRGPYIRLLRLGCERETSLRLLALAALFRGPTLAGHTVYRRPLCDLEPGAWFPWFVGLMITWAYV